MDVPISLFAALNSCRYLYVRRIEEPIDNQLRLVIEEAEASQEAVSHEVGGVEFADCRSIESSDRCRLFEIRWESYIAYSVRDESFTMMDDYEETEWGKLAVVYTKSRFLEFVAAGTLACETRRGPFRHFGFNCLNHTIDVASAELPSVRLLRPREPESRMLM